MYECAPSPCKKHFFPVRPTESKKLRQAQPASRCSELEAGLEQPETKWKVETALTHSFQFPLVNRLPQRYWIYRLGQAAGTGSCLEASTFHQHA